ncbi:hypothetical protein TWF694_001638 [Orbilia ellipsospora]|uniref:GPI anchored serine-threonine rich protein n=1 Tax=Orbilia ellipsospora TaxID=2528407 RepID=A0AAV9X985_9PEZI
MRFTTILSVAVFAGISFAQTTAPAGSGGPGTGCPAQNVLVACLASQNSRLAACAQLDYACMCQVQADVLQCYNQCPNDVNRSTEQSKLTAWCVAASATMTTPASTFSVVSTPAASNTVSNGATQTGGSYPTDEATNPSSSGSTPASKTSGTASTSTNTPNSGAKVTWMCASSLMAVLTAAFMAL